MKSVLADLRAAARGLLAARGFTIVAVTTLAAGVALASMVLLLLNAYVVKGLPYPAADRLYRVQFTSGDDPLRGLDQADWASLDDIVECRIAWDLDFFYMFGGELPEGVPGAWVTPGFVTGYGVDVALGRTLGPADFDPSNPPVALISDRVWRTRFDQDPGVVGRTFRAYVSDRPDEPETFTIVGVLPPDWWHLNTYTDVLAPLKAPAYPYELRLKPGVSADFARERIANLVRATVGIPQQGFDVVLTSSHDGYIAAIRPLLSSVTATAALVLLIAVANVSVLVLVRGRQREKELAVRLALGASYARVVRLLALEGLLIAGTATGVGLAVSSASAPRIAAFVEQFLERRVPGGVDALAMSPSLWIVAAAVGIPLLAVFTLAPLAVILRSGHLHQLSASARGATLPRGAARTRASLIVVEIAASLTLLTGATLMAASAVRMLQVELGFTPGDIVAVELALRGRSYPDESSRAGFVEQLTRRADSILGGESIFVTDFWPLQAPRLRQVSTSGTPQASVRAGVFAVTPGYFDALGMRLREGRRFTPEDRLGGEPGVIVSESLARALWPQEPASGRLIAVPSADGRDVTTARVVGVVNDVRQTHADAELMDLYWPLAQHPARFPYVYLRDPRSPSWEHELRAAIAAVDRNVAIGTPRRLSESAERERARLRLMAAVLTILAALACALALVGTYGVIAYAGRQRQREIAVRLAVGADRRSIGTMFLRQGLLLLLIGLLAGLAGSLGLGRVLESQLFGVHPAEPRLLLAAGVAFGLCGLAAIWWPARRAAGVDPALLLKDE